MWNANQCGLLTRNEDSKEKNDFYSKSNVSMSLGYIKQSERTPHLKILMHTAGKLTKIWQ